MNFIWRMVIFIRSLDMLFSVFWELKSFGFHCLPLTEMPPDIYTSWRLTQNQWARLCNLAAFVVLIYLLASVNDFIIKNSKALLKAKLGLVRTQKYHQGKSLKAPANKETSSDVWKDIKCDINLLNADDFVLVEIWVKVCCLWICQVSLLGTNVPFSSHILQRQSKPGTWGN